MGMVEVRRLQQLEDGHHKLKPPVADLTLDSHMLQEITRKTRYTPIRAGGWCSSCEAALRLVCTAPAT
jgi:hypothetical protein